MRLQISRTKNAASFYVVKTVYSNGKKINKVHEKLGTEKDLKEKLGDIDIEKWARDYVDQINRLAAENKEPDVIAKFSPSSIIAKNENRLFNGGYLFLERIYHELGIHMICKDISQRYKFDFDLDSILSRLVYSRIIYPSSKSATFDLSKNFIEQPKFELHQIFRALDVLSKENFFIQSSLYENSLKVANRNSKILYYDCTNYFFEIEQEDVDGIRKYGVSKEHKPNPIVQMGLFMDGDGVPLAFNINSGNTNEQKTLLPLEKKILSDFNLSKFIVCTDAGLSSLDNRKFNVKNERSFITTQSIKKLKEHLKNWAISNEGWRLPGNDKLYNLSEISDIFDNANETQREKILSKTFYKERWIKENDLEQHLIVTFSFKYRDYQRTIRQSQIDRALKAISSSKSNLKKLRQNDYKRFIERTTCTEDGEVAEKEIYSIDNELIKKEELFDGFYGVCTNLDGDPEDIIKINHRRWEIEECFRIMKSEFKARPVFLSNEARIEAHFLTCFMSLLIYRLLEKKLGEKYTCYEIIDGIRKMNLHESKGNGYIPSYKRTDFTDDLHEAFGFRTDYEIVTLKQMKKILKITKNK
jgi:transposase